MELEGLAATAEGSYVQLSHRHGSKFEASRVKAVLVFGSLLARASAFKCLAVIECWDFFVWHAMPLQVFLPSIELQMRFTLLGVPYWGPDYKGVLLFGGLF